MFFEFLQFPSTNIMVFVSKRCVKLAPDSASFNYITPYPVDIAVKPMTSL